MRIQSSIGVWRTQASIAGGNSKPKQCDATCSCRRICKITGSAKPLHTQPVFAGGQRLPSCDRKPPYARKPRWLGCGTTGGAKRFRCQRTESFELFCSMPRGPNVSCCSHCSWKQHHCPTAGEPTGDPTGHPDWLWRSASAWPWLGAVEPGPATATTGIGRSPKPKRIFWSLAVFASTNGLAASTANDHTPTATALDFSGASNVLGGLLGVVPRYLSESKGPH